MYFPAYKRSTLLGGTGFIRNLLHRREVQVRVLYPTDADGAVIRRPQQFPHSAIAGQRAAASSSPEATAPFISHNP